MGGGLLQLIANGQQDKNLTGNPQITFFKSVYRRHTMFSIETIPLSFEGNANFNNKVSCIISRNADLISKIVLKVKLPIVSTSSNLWEGYVNNIGHALIQQVEIKIGGQLIDRHYSNFLDIYDELYENSDQRKLLSKFKTNTSIRTNNAARTVSIPLKFWFCNNPGLALPLIALQYHEVELSVIFNPLEQLVKSNAAFTSPTGSFVDTSILVDYIYLDTDERRRFAQSSHEYLIEQVQFGGAENISSSDTTKNVELVFNHPCKALHWVFVTNTNSAQNSITGNNNFCYSSSSGGALYSSLYLLFNGQQRFRTQDEDYFRLVQHLNHFNRVPDKYIGTYSFSLKPIENQPSGTANFSKIDKATMCFTINSGESKLLYIYAVNYNILRIMSGMGGLGYAN